MRVLPEALQLFKMGDVPKFLLHEDDSLGFIQPSVMRGRYRKMLAEQRGEVGGGLKAR